MNPEDFEVLPQISFFIFIFLNTDYLFTVLNFARVICYELWLIFPPAYWQEFRGEGKAEWFTIL